MKASDLIKAHGWSPSEPYPTTAAKAGLETDRLHCFTRNADGTLRTSADTYKLRGAPETMRYCINGALCKAYCEGNFEQFTRHEQPELAEKMIRMAQHVVQGPVYARYGGGHHWDRCLEALVTLARWQDAEGRTADEVIAILESEGL